MIELEETRSTQAVRWSSLALGVARLALVGAAIGWSLPLLSLVDSAFVLQNALSTPGRTALTLGVVGGAASAVLVALVMVVVKRWGAARSISRLAIALGPLAILAFLPVLLQPSIWYSNPLPFLAMLSVLVVLLERILLAWGREFGPALAALRDLPRLKLPTRVRRALPLMIVVLGAVGYSVFAFHFSLQQHHRLQTQGYDLGIYDNLMFNAMRGHPFRSTVLLGPHGPSYLVGHAEFAMLLFVPLYWLWPSADMLLALQAVSLGFAAVPLYFFARAQLTRGAALLIALAYLLFAPMHGSSFYDFHWLPVSMFFQFLFYFAIAMRKNWLIGVCYVTLVLIREDISVGLSVLGLFLLFTGIRPKLGLFLALCSAFTFVGIKFGIMLWAGPFFFADLYYRQLIAPGEAGFGSVTRTLLTNPAFVINTVLEPKKLSYFLHLMAPLAFIPLRKPFLLLLICSASLFTFLTTAYDPTISITFQYSAHWIPYLFAAIVLMLGVLSKRPDGTLRRRAALGAVAFGVCVHSYVFGALMQNPSYVGGFTLVPFQMSDAEKETYAALRSVAALIPKEASVAATDPEVPHVSNRYSIYTLRTHHGDADYLFLNRNFLSGEGRNLVNDAVERNSYGLVAHKGPYYLFKRGAMTRGTHGAFQSLGVRHRSRSDEGSAE